MTTPETAKFSLHNLSLQDANILVSGLGKLPLEVSADLWARLRTQVEKQIAALTPPPSPGEQQAPESANS
jgi:hypothetical protein